MCKGALGLDLPEGRPKQSRTVREKVERRVESLLSVKRFILVQYSNLTTVVVVEI